MFKEKFDMVLQKDEEIIWSSKTNILANILKGIIPTILLCGFISLWSIIFFGSLFSSTEMNEQLNLIYILYSLLIIVVLYIIYSFLKSKNTYFAITNKRIIERTGAFKNSFIHYSLKNIGTIQVNGTIVDSKNSATLLISTKNFHTDSKDNSVASFFKISSLYNAYEAYNILSELVEGNNENLRIKIEK